METTDEQRKNFFLDYLMEQYPEGDDFKVKKNEGGNWVGEVSTDYEEGITISLSFNGDDLDELLKRRHE